MKAETPSRFRTAPLDEPLAVLVPRCGVLVAVDIDELAALADLPAGQRITGAVFLASTDVRVWVNDSEARYIGHHCPMAARFGTGDELQLEAPYARASVAHVRILPFSTFIQ